MSYYYKVLKKSVTGQKLNLIAERIFKSQNQLTDFLDEVGAEAFRPSNHPFLMIGGQLTSICQITKSTEGLKKYKKFDNEFIPNLRTPRGKELRDKMGQFETVTKEELNKCVGINLNESSSIGFAMADEEYFGFMVTEIQAERSKFISPSDCTEITLTEFNKLSNP